jgi:APA family basic amino acid/polyamine antiporter
MKSPQRTLPAALLSGTVIVALFYIALNVVFLYALPVDALKNVVPVGAVTATALFGGGVGKLFSALMAAGLLSCVSAMSLAGPRVYYAMAQDGCFPSIAARVHPRWGTPVPAILLQAIASCALVLSGTYEALIYYIGILLILFAALAVAGLMRLRKKLQWRLLREVSWGYPVIPILFISASLWMLAWTMAVRKRESVVAFLTLAAGGLLYRWKFRRKSISASP